ncbi:MAG: ABC transporter ATP-binding protein [Lysinibacillus sp.]|nr:ABC transporter ATP-binding protein [Lysinibacillus sp.]
MAELQLLHISKVYKDNYAVHNFNLTILPNEFIVIVGPSGCGKSTLLRMIAGLESVTEGKIIYDGKKINDVPSKTRNFAFVFQNYAIYPHMNVYSYLSFGLKMQKIPKREIDKRVKQVASLLGIDHLLTTNSMELSGGEKQRVALGRAMVRKAELFLMDEPLSNLDPSLRFQMRNEIINLHRKLEKTFIYVTHDQTEAMTMGDRIVVMKDGQVLQVGKPEEVYRKPNNLFVAQFLGSPGMNFFTCKFHRRECIVGNHKIPIPEEMVKVLANYDLQKEIILGIRPEDIQIQSRRKQESTFKVKIDKTELLGAERLIYTTSNNQPFIIKTSSDISLEDGQEISIALNTEKIHFFDKNTEKRIV